MVQAKVGQYFYGRHRNSWGVWIWDYVSEDGTSSSGSFVGDFEYREEARAYVWAMNGWGKPKARLA